MLDSKDELALYAKRIVEQFEVSKTRRMQWHGLWQDCYDYALPQNACFNGFLPQGQSRMAKVFDATALDAADQLAASLLANLTPPWSQWFGLKPGPDLSDREALAIAPVLEKAGRVIQSHFDRSNFAVEIHQCYLDLVVGGTACISFEETEPGGFSAFKFSANPLFDVVLEEGHGGALDTMFRQSHLSLQDLTSKYPNAELPVSMKKRAGQDMQAKYTVLEAVLPKGSGYEYWVFLIDGGRDPQILRQGHFEQSPMIAFRWMKSAGETYGRSPIMKALPDIKTANKVVELILKNASIAVTGIWQADDDGILNPANIELVPGSIIPKAVGSKGLQPLEMPGRFDVSQLMLDNLQSRIRHALLVDRLLPPAGVRMTATEVMERSAEVSMLLGATYGRLQSELLTPLIKRAFAILRRRGEVPDIALDGRMVSVDYRAPLAKLQGQRDVQNTLGWVNAVSALGAHEGGIIDVQATARYLSEALSVPSHLLGKAFEENIKEGGYAHAE